MGACSEYWRRGGERDTRYVSDTYLHTYLVHIVSISFCASVRCLRAPTEVGYWRERENTRGWGGESTIYLSLSLSIHTSTQRGHREGGAGRSRGTWRGHVPAVTRSMRSSQGWPGSIRPSTLLRPLRQLLRPLRHLLRLLQLTVTSQIDLSPSPPSAPSSLSCSLSLFPCPL